MIGVDLLIVMVVILLSAGVLSIIPLIRPIYLTVEHFVKEKLFKEKKDHYGN